MTITPEKIARLRAVPTSGPLHYRDSMNSPGVALYAPNIYGAADRWPIARICGDGPDARKREARAFVEARNALVPLLDEIERLNARLASVKRERDDAAARLLEIEEAAADARAD